MVYQKTNQNVEDVEKLAKQIGDLMQVLENSKKRERLSSGVMSHIDRLSM